MPIVSTTHDHKNYEVKTDSIVYDALLDHGLDLPHGCLSGSCGACRIQVIDGLENLTPPSFIEKNTLESLKHEFNLNEDFPLRLACRAKVIGDVKIKSYP